MTTPAMENLGAHLLGRVASDPDERDWKLGDYLIADPIRNALAKVTKSPWVPGSVKLWATLVTNIVDPAPGPTPGPPGPPAPPAPPSPTPTPVNGGWLDADDPVLDQGQTPHCVGFTGADWMNALPVDDHVKNPMGDDLYYACKVIDGEPRVENGSSVKSLMRVLQQRGKLTNYAAASTIDEVTHFVTTQGPVCWGIGWTQSMFTPDENGLVVPSGNDVGGHAIIEFAYDASNDLHWLLNHWGDAWGKKGTFCMRGADLASRLANGGEAWAAVEVATSVTKVAA